MRCEFLKVAAKGRKTLLCKLKGDCPLLADPNADIDCLNLTGKQEATLDPYRTKKGA